MALSRSTTGNFSQGDPVYVRHEPSIRPADEIAPVRLLSSVARLAASILLANALFSTWGVTAVCVSALLAFYSLLAILPAVLRTRLLPGGALGLACDLALTWSLVSVTSPEWVGVTPYAVFLCLPLFRAALTLPLGYSWTLAALVGTALPFVPVLSKAGGAVETTHLAAAGGVGGILLVSTVALSSVRWNEYIKEIARSAERERLETAGVTRTGANSKSGEDPVTGVLNRTGMLEPMEAILARPRAGVQNAAIILVDLDHFGDLNASVGHRAGDEILGAIAERLIKLTVPDDVVARISADLFCVAKGPLEDAGDAHGLATRILEEIARPLQWGKQEIFMTACAGIALAPEDGVETETLLRKAEIALRQARAAGTGRIKQFVPDSNSDTTERMELEAELRHAIERDELFLLYQPKVDMERAVIVGFEALIRWRHPSRGVISPGKFIPLAEQTGLIVPITDWALRTACKQNRMWQEAGYAHVNVGVNLSGKQFEQHSVVPSVVAALKESGLDARWLDLEITEGIALGDPALALTTLRALKELGVEISLDDFGTGYSSLSYLRKFPFDTIKIDQSFVRELGEDPGAVAIAATIIDLARNLERKVTAEGVETEEQLLHLRMRGCHQVQGFLISKPIPAEEITRQFQTRRTGAVQRYSRFASSDETLFESITRYSYPIPVKVDI